MDHWTQKLQDLPFSESAQTEASKNGPSHFALIYISISQVDRSSVEDGETNNCSTSPLKMDDGILRIWNFAACSGLKVMVSGQS